MDKLKLLEYLDYSLSMLECEVETYRVALRICDFQTAESQAWSIEERCDYVEMNARAYRDVLNER